MKKRKAVRTCKRKELPVAAKAPWTKQLPFPSVLIGILESDAGGRDSAG
ncbi:hypothetical protein R0137_03770 [Congregibacter brevis]|uniref:Uncharacterized protein n=1 Tax=Congregibacter brevis TaxID=3081201 RepID=A0ABZ0IF84_9GAMM|nr:hypothetical protein R0137_03770 [Congregibacter sp. IMCC45268]